MHEMGMKSTSEVAMSQWERNEDHLEENLLGRLKEKVKKINKVK